MVFCTFEITSNTNKKKLFQFKEAMYAKNPIEKNEVIKNK